MIKFSCTNENYTNDLMELVRAFEQRTDECLSLDVSFVVREGEICIKLTSDKFDNFCKYYRYPLEFADATEKKRLEKRYLKMAIYGTLVFLTGVTLPYGCLTGIRPTKLYMELGDAAHDTFLKDFSVSPSKVELIERTVNTQKNLRNGSERNCDVFVFIPFCPTKCAYCSFVSLPIDRQKKLLRPYTDCLVEELRAVRRDVEEHGINVRSVYIGGGTPTALPLAMLDEVLAECHYDVDEFTVEAGRPDTITPSVLNLLKKHGVTRISVNPQTFNDKTLELIGRKHKSEQVVKAFKRAKKMFKVNMDLIAMLPEETLDDFKYSVDKAVELSPENITVHTLYLKRGSLLRNEGYRNTENTVAEQMVDYAYRKLTEAGYNPYYMYRQKYTSGNLENVGYAKAGEECIYNIDIMEEDTSILAAGAAAISKKVTRSINLIERCANFKEPLEYVKHFDEVLKKGGDFRATFPYFDKETAR